MSTQQQDAVQTDIKPRVPLWRNRDFLLLLSGQGISSIGTQVSQFAFPLLTLALTRSPAQTGLITALRGLPYALFSLPAGALVDRWNRKLVMILCDTGRAIALAMTGLLLQTIGPIPTVLVLFVPQLALAIAVTLNKHVRHAPSVGGL